MEMQRKFLRFILVTIVIGTAIIIALSGCSIYEAIDEKLHSPPEIEEEADYFIEKYHDGKLDVNLTISVTNGDIAMFYYSCRADDGWDSEREVGSQRVVDGRARNSHITMCGTKLMVQVVVYNNFRKRSQRHNEMAWVINLEDHKPL